MSLRRFFHNLKYLFEYDIKKVDMLEKSLLHRLQYLEYKYRQEPTGSLGKPLMHSVQETMRELQNSERSLVRYGEGELRLIEGEGLFFQKPSKELSARLAEILHSDDERVMLAVPGELWYSCSEMPEREWNWWFTRRSMFRLIAEAHLREGKRYYETAITYPSYGMDFYEEWRRVWQDKDIAVICGKKVFSALENNIFDNARSVEYLHVPTKHAFSSYAEIYRRACGIAPHKLILVIAGPTATVLAYDLAVKAGRRCLDVGHLAKSYDVLKRELPENHRLMVNFWGSE